ncbi:MAG: hypothetical protein OK456_11425 [Thaumarchaeota archaeon]|nr:hypothetical protein [Nitrososphaerota archaeon]
MNLPAIAVVGALAAALSYLSARYFSKKFVKMGMTGNDIHKPGRPVTAEMGGVSVLLAFFTGSVVLMFATSDPSLPLLAGVATVSGAGLVGVADDMTNMRQRYKPFLIGAAALPLTYALWGPNAIVVPILGSLPVGYIFPLLVVPVAVAISANFTNMLAGFNGLEAGSAAIAIGALTFLAAYRGSYPATVIGALLVSGYLGFLVLNWYPAKIFPGDVGTLIAGAGIATIAVLAGLEFAAIVVSIPAGIDFALKMIARRPFGGRRIFGDTTIDGKGNLVAPSYPALVHALMRAEPTGERGLVESVLGMQALYAALAITITLVFV